MIIPFNDGVLLIRDNSSFLMVASAGQRFSLCIDSANDEYFQSLEADDLIAVSAPEGGEPAAAFMLIELVRRYKTPLIVLNKGHPGSRRLRYVVSAGPVIETNCDIRRGTHPEQHLICASEGLSGITLKGLDGGCEIVNIPKSVTVERFRAEINLMPSGPLDAKPGTRSQAQD
jgi:hypothetical protein